MYNKSGFTLVEIIVASIIFALVTVGLLSVFVAGNQHIIHARERMIGVELGKLFIDPLQMDVRQDTWGQPGNRLRVGVSASAAQSVNGRDFSAVYRVENVNGTDLRRVTTTITWNEPSF